MKSLKAAKTALTKEIKAQKEYLQDLKSCMESQGEKYFFDFEGRKCDRYMYLGEFFFPRTVKKEEMVLAKMVKDRAEMDKIKDCSDEVFTVIHEIQQGSVEAVTVSLELIEDEDEDGRYNFLSGSHEKDVEVGESMVEVEVENIDYDLDGEVKDFKVEIKTFYDQEGNEKELNEVERGLLEKALESVVQIEIT